MVTIRVRETSKDKSRAKAACRASWPIPGESQRSSIGINAPIAILTDTPLNPINCGSAVGNTCHQKILRTAIPFARAAMTCDLQKLASRMLRV